MKKLLFLTVVLTVIVQVTSHAQSIKLNNQADPGSAMLEVSSSSKGILIPNVALTGITDATTIALPAASLLVYNTATVSDVEPGYYYNSGTSGSPFWTRLSTSTGTAGDGSETKVTAGTNVTVTGSGTSISPYIVGALSGDGSETKVTAGTNVTVTGSGTTGSPYLVDAAGGDGSETKVTAGTNVTVTGIGTSASPYIVGAVSGDGSETKVTAGTNVTVTGSGTTGSPYLVDAAGGDGSETKVTAGTNVTVTGIGTSASPYIVNAATSSPTYTIGLSEEQGGYIFWVSTDGKHGLVAETINQGGAVPWFKSNFNATRFTNHSAAGAKFRDWRVPTIWELIEIYPHKDAIGGFSNVTYWSSSEEDNVNAYIFTFGIASGGASPYGYKYSDSNVRAVRAF